MKIGLTGATGRLGRLVVDELTSRHDASDLVAVIRDPAKADDLRKSGIEVRVADYDDRSSLDAAFGGLDKLLLISGNALGRRVAQHSSVIDAAKAAGVRHLGYTSAPKATSSPMALAVEHKGTEEYLAASGLDYTVLRNNWYTENFAEAIKNAGATGVLVAPAAADRVASAPRADYAAGAAAVLTGDGHEGKVYELSGDRAWDFQELADTIGEVNGAPCVFQPVGDQEDLKAALVAGGMDEVSAGFFVITSSNMAGGALAEASPELSSLLGRPTAPLRDSVEEILG